MGRGHSQARILASLLGGLALILVGILATQSPHRAIQVASAQGVTVEQTPIEMMQELDDLIVRYQAIQLDAAFLSSPGFRALKDFSIVIPRPTSVGRDNPFAPLPPSETEDAVDSEPAPFSANMIDFGEPAVTNLPL